nr:hypothetical protein [Actinomycetales bacterium]
MSPAFRRRTLAPLLGAVLALASCTATVPQEAEPSRPTATHDPVPLSSFDLSGLSELGYEHNPNLESANLTQWQSPGCIVQALVAPTVGSGDDAADSVAAFDSLGPEFTGLTEGGWVRLPLGEGGTLTMTVRKGAVSLDGAAAPIDVAARSVGEVGTLFVITHSCEQDAQNPTSIEGVVQRIILDGVLNPDA